MHNEPQSASQTQEIIQELQEMSLDPTLDQCCRRDIESQIRSEQIRQTLQQHDRVDTRQRVTSTAICRDPGKLAVLQDLPQPKVSQLKDYEGVLSADHELEQLRRQRLRQLQAQAAVQQEQRQAEFGCLNMVQESKLMVRRRLATCLRGRRPTHHYVRPAIPCHYVTQPTCFSLQPAIVDGQLQCVHGEPIEAFESKLLTQVAT